MNEIQYVGEVLLPGKLGNLFVILAFSCGLLSTISYFNSSGELDHANSWKKLGRFAFRAHSLSVMAIVGTLFYMLFNQLFEYHYVWQHSNTNLPLRYIFSCFWEGQEGSFLLWMLWHVVLGNILLHTAKNWEAPVMTIFSSVQVFLASMLLGIYLGDYNIGSSPFNVLLREHPDFVNLPLFENANYLQNLDGRGLNPLLQNYWMTIHPPTLFLGFASTLIPFCFAVAGLWKRKYTEWLKPCLPWAFFGVGILGIGILMGGAWAYEALSFGGFWAWDPVENASLVPWLTFVGAAHVMLVQKNKGTSLAVLFFLTIITFILILYSTFLTRSGILGDSSVHAFTDLGMSGQLLIYLLFFLALGIGLLIMRAGDLPKTKTEEALWSREFWMFIGALVLFISAFQIIFTTSIPVVNKVFGTNMAPPQDVFDHYHKFQIPVAILITLFISFGQFLKYKKSNFSDFIKKLNLAFGISLAVASCFAYFLELTNPFYILLLFTSIFSIISNFDYFTRILKGKVINGGGSIAHIGFGCIMLGALVSTSKNEIISTNRTGIDIRQIGENFENRESSLLFLNDTVQMGEHFISYKGKSREGVNVFYEVEYMNKTTSGYETDFTLYPRVQTNPRMGNVSEPDTRHYWNKDIYTHVTYAELEKRDTHEDGFNEPVTETIGLGDTLFTSSHFVILNSFNRALNKSELQVGDSDIVVGAELQVIDMQNKTHLARPIFVLQPNGATYTIPAALEELGIEFAFSKIHPEKNKVDITYREKKKKQREFIIMKALVFPYINILWIGCILLLIGTAIAVLNRIQLARR